MRKIFLRVFVSLMAVVFTVTCQVEIQAKSKIQDFIKVGTYWLGKTSGKATDFISTGKYGLPGFSHYPKPYRCIGGTTLIDGVEYMRLCEGVLLCKDMDQFVYDEDSPHIAKIENMIGGNEFGKLLALIRIEDGKMFVYNMLRSKESDPKEFLYYDFNMEVGDVRTLGSYGLYTAADMVTIDGRDLRQIDVKCIGKGTVTSCGNTFDILYMDFRGVFGEFMGQHMYSVFDCLGSSRIGLDSIVMFSGRENVNMGEYDGVFYPTLYLETMVCDGKVVFKSSDIKEENMTLPDLSQIESVNGETNDADAPVYSIDGTKTDPSSPGIKISKGKKYLNVAH